MPSPATRAHLVQRENLKISPTIVSSDLQSGNPENIAGSIERITADFFRKFSRPLLQAQVRQQSP
jgi:hypothetical protein